MAGTPTYRGTIFPGSSGEGANNASRFYMLASGAGDVSTEVQYQTVERTAGTLDRLQVYVASNAKTSASQTWHSRVATANGNLTVVITHGTTGRFEDTTNSDSITAGNALDISFTNGGGDLGVINITVAVCRFTATSGTSTMFGTNAASGGNIFSASSASTSNYLGLSGHYATLATSETAVYQTRLRSAGTLSRWQTYISTNSRAAASTLGSRYDGAGGNGSVTITASTIGFYEDVTNSDTVASGHLANYVFTTGTGTGTLSAMLVACRFVGSGVGWDCVAGSDATAAQSAPSTSVNNFAGVLGSSRPIQTEASVQTKVYEASAVSHLLAYVGTNSSGTSVTTTFRVGGADGTQTATITATTVGLYEDTTNSDTLANGSLINFKHTPPNSATFDINQWSVTFGSATNTETASVVMAFGPLGFSVAAARKESAGVVMAFGPLGFNVAAVRSESAAVVMAFGPIGLAVKGFDILKSTLRQFWTR